MRKKITATIWLDTPIFDAEGVEIGTDELEVEVMADVTYIPSSFTSKGHAFYGWGQDESARLVMVHDVVRLDTCDRVDLSFERVEDLLKEYLSANE